MRIGITDLPLHYGKCPPWLFEKMRELAREITKVIVYEYSQEEILKRLADPYWFQGFSCILGYDWNSSGTTTVTCGALKEALNQEELGLAVCGGKGKTSRKAPNEIEKFGDEFSLSTKQIEELIYSSRMSAKVDSAVLQDNYNLYHHCFIFSESGKWVVIQQGMNYENRYARRYHWISGFETFVEEPHNAICCDKKEKNILNMTAKDSKDARDVSVDLIKENPMILQKTLDGVLKNEREIHLALPKKHTFKLNKQTMNALKTANEIQPNNYEELVAIRGIGPKSVRALALISDLIYGKPPSWKDPVKYSFAHGGKDGIPYPVNRRVMEKSIEILRSAVDNAKIGEKDRLHAIRRLNYFLQ